MERIAYIFMNADINSIVHISLNVYEFCQDVIFRHVYSHSSQYMF